ncbi:O-antigen ligase family protein [Microvirga sp. 2TAF3]|uniref:O-antigen ligase family protein n=1 Tax=Microvirga sp. 2TAF3 TaxID=3233014 RepID=UPI003F95AB5B
MAFQTSTDSPSTTAALLVALGWIVALMTAISFGPAAYLAPVLGLALSVVTIVTLHAAWKRPAATALLFAFIIFALNFNFRQRELGVTGLDWQNGVKLASWSVLLTLGLIRWRQIAFFLKEPAFCLSFAYATVALASACWSEVPAYTAASATGLFAYLALACFVANDLSESAALRIMVWALGTYVAIGLTGGILVPGITWLAPSAEESLNRLQGFSGHPNVFGQEIGVFITITLIAWRSRLIGKLVSYFLLMLGAVAILATGSRTTLLALMIAWGAVVLRSSRHGSIAVFLGACCLSIILMIAAVGGLSDLGDLLSQLSRTGHEREIFTLTGRTEVWSTVWDLILQKPFFGWGYNGTEELISSNMSPSFTGTAVNAHNMFLQSLLSLGFLGSLPGFALFALLVTRFFTHPDPARDQLTIFLLVAGMGEVELFVTPVLLTLVTFWIIVREAMRGMRQTSRTHRNLPSPQGNLGLESQ